MDAPQHKRITGYRDLTDGEIAVMNNIKLHGRELQLMISGLRVADGVDQRWVAIAETHLQQGIMAAVRAVAKPDSF